MSQSGTLTLGTSTWQITYLNDPVAMAQGLSGVASLNSGYAVLFDMGAEQIIQVTTEDMLFNL